MQENPTLIKSALADAAISAHRFVKLTSTGVATATTGTDKIYGVHGGDVAAASGGTIPVVVLGTAIVTASTAISKLAYVTATTNGKAVTTTSSGDTVRGIALQAASADGDLIEILLTYFKY